jgi:hypothetical protein
MTYRKIGVWTYQDICDFEDCTNMGYFEIIGNGIRVKRKEAA